MFQFEDDSSGYFEHNYYDHGGFSDVTDFDFNAGRAFPQNFSTLYEIEETF
jgi:hypothetical protein